MVQAVPDFCPECSSRSLRLSDDGTVRCDTCRFVLIEAPDTPAGLEAARKALADGITRRPTYETGESE